jgi:hypothetical protein
MVTSNILRIVSKDNSSEQVFLDLDPSTLPSLKPSSVRIQTQFIGLSATSIAYCALGDQIGWWNSFAVPEQAPSEYQDGRWGVAPVWGYAIVLQSTISSLKEGAWLWGHMPTAGCTFDLELKQSDAAHEHWQEISERRAKLQPLYNRYIVVDSDSVQSTSNVARFEASLKSTFESAYLLNKWVFAPRGKQSVHPAPETGNNWSAADGDLTSTLIICLGAGSRTSRAFVYQLAVTRPAGERPAGVIEVTEDNDGVLRGIAPSFNHERVSYDELQSPRLVFLLHKFKFNRAVVIDFGGRGNAISIVTEQLQKHFPDRERVIIGVGVEQNAQTTNELRAKVGLGLQQGGTTFSTSGLNEAAIKLVGETKYYQQMNEEFRDMVDSELARNNGSASEGKVLGIGLDEKYGLRGHKGLEGAWSDLYTGKAVGSRGLVVDLQTGKDAN